MWFKKKYDNLYLDIIKIGRDKVGEGLSYNKLKSLLEKKGYDFGNDCIELAVKQWFINSFHHRGEDNKPITELKDLENHPDCNFILKGESSLLLITHQKSKNALMISLCAIFLSFSAFMYKLYDDMNKLERKNENLNILPEKTIIENIEKKSLIIVIGKKEDLNSFLNKIDTSNFAPLVHYMNLK
jgi:hypothetical protein